MYKACFACSKKPIPGSVNLDPSFSNSGSGSSKMDSMNDSAASSSPSNAIDFPHFGVIVLRPQSGRDG
ncbi:hypothetical protein HAX54_010551 [Datura stramonium]|uniref:Uncharacterized protein n=1 Tax=Datura stramonium TaxID=4076 RepID=A0ABS8TJ62_DATST|nr:hypothetical protein [Datura stramonium]